MFEKILIANRGEIACRVIKTARSMGIKTVAVYSEVDATQPHVTRADEAYCIGAAPAADSYLRAEAILEACRESGAEAVHPGYGFLSENAQFADTLSAAGIVFIGPPVNAIQMMGDKITSKRIAQQAGVNTIPGHEEFIRDPDHAVEVATSIGYPVMIKATAGGGGKGMRVADSDESCRDGFERARSEARSSFGDDRVFIEKFIVNPRHIEIQVLADSHGNTVHLGERECSLQRRHQKVIEEAPSSFLDEHTRVAMGEQAVALAVAVSYTSAGTVEFIVDAERNFYFLEMNTRLQVEHPVTELVTGVDLVELMIRVAAGEPLPFEQNDIRLEGCAIEGRVYAEDPFRNFLPSVGRLMRYREPAASEKLRLDTGVEEGSEVSIYYDPMIGKVIGYASDRAEAARTLSHALDELTIRGVTSNVRFLQCLLNHPQFLAGDFSTHFIDEHFPEGFGEQHASHVDRQILVAVAAYLNIVAEQRAQTLTGRMPGASSTPGTSWVVLEEQLTHPVQVTLVDGGCEVTSDDRIFALRSQWQPGEELLHVNVNAEQLSMQVRREGVCYRVTHAGAEIKAQVLRPRAAELFAHMLVVEPPDLSRFLLSPMPGLLISISVDVGEEVKEGQELAVIEAMKMENSLRAVSDGTVSQVLAAAGESLAVDQPIIEFDA